jgi:hypothetical protein
MAGIKHSLWGLPPEDRPNLTRETEEDWYKYMATHNIKNCKLCGSPITQAVQDATGKRVDFEWEMQNELHQHCYTDYIINLRNSQRGPQA